MNKIFLTGRLTRDPELKATTTGKEVVSFSLAVNRRFTQGETKADFFSCQAWGQTAAFINKFFHKGDGITLCGRIESRKYTAKDGTERTVWDVTADEVEFPLGKVGGSKYDSSTAQLTPDEFTEISPDEIPF